MWQLSPKGLWSDSYVPYPPRPGRAVGGGYVAGTLAGTPPPSPSNNPSSPLLATVAGIVYLPNPGAVPAVIQPSPYGGPVTLKYVQVVNQGAGFVLVLQGQILGINPPFSRCSYILTEPGSQLELMGWDGGASTVTDTTGIVYILWGSNRFAEDLTWVAPTPAAGPLVFDTFETGTDGWTSYIGTTGNPSTTQPAQSNIEAYAGTYSLFVTGTGDGSTTVVATGGTVNAVGIPATPARVSGGFPVTSARNYLVSAFTFVTGLVETTWLYIAWFNSSNTWLSDSLVTEYNNSPQNAWLPNSGTVTAPVGATTGMGYLIVETGSSDNPQVYLDNFRVEVA